MSEKSMLRFSTTSRTLHLVLVSECQNRTKGPVRQVPVVSYVSLMSE